MKCEKDLAKTLEAAQLAFASLVDSRQQQDTSKFPPLRMYSPREFREERLISLEIESGHSINQRPTTKDIPTKLTLTQYENSRLRPQPRRSREAAMLKYIENQTNFLSAFTDPQEREKQVRLLKKYIEFYASSPTTYPADTENKIHCLIRQAGTAVLMQEELKLAEGKEAQILSFRTQSKKPF